MTEPPPLYTIGHSTKTVAAFVELLQAGSVQLVIDVRSVPRSRTNPQFNFDTLPEALAPWQIGYIRIEELGGLRPKSKLVDPHVNGFWINQSFHNYADYALSDAFRRGLSQLNALAADRRCAIMCAEAVWWRCHRRIIADYLLADEGTVCHLMGETRVDPAKMTPAAITAEDGLHYPAD